MAKLRVLSTLATFVLSSRAVCFYPDGITTDPGHRPCNSTLQQSACCDPMDSCTTSGLCLGRTGFVYRGSCTDSTWSSDVCPKKCLADPFNNAPYSIFTALWPCGAQGQNSVNYCCGSANRNCCTIAQFAFGTTGTAYKGGMDLLLAEIANSSNSSDSLSQATITVTVTARTAAQTSSNSGAAFKAASISSSLGPAIGAGIGVPLGILAIGVVSFLFWREGKNRRAETAARMQSIEMNPGNRPHPEMYTKSYVYEPGPPPAPPHPQSTSSLQSRFEPMQKSPVMAGRPAGVHELI